MRRRSFLKHAISVPILASSLKAGESASAGEIPNGRYQPGRIDNDYSLFLPGEREALQRCPQPRAMNDASVSVEFGGETQTLKIGEAMSGWRLVAILPHFAGGGAAVFEKHVTHQGVIVYATESGEAIRIPKHVGDLSKIRPRPTSTPHGVKLERPERYMPGPDCCGDYILNSNEDPCYENIAALGAELIGWTLVANEEAGPEKSLFLEADGKSRELSVDAQCQWAPDLVGRLFDPHRFLPSEYLYDSVTGYSKRTLLGGYLPAADIGVWNPKFRLGYEVMVILPAGADARPLGRIRAMKPPTGESSARPVEPEFDERYWNSGAEDFFTALAALWSHWRNFFESRMTVEIPDPWLLDVARAGIVLSRCSYQGLNPSYQIGEGAYTKIPVRSHALFPVAHYEFVWAQQLWNLTEEVEPYFQHYLDHYILPDGNFLYNTQDQVEAPLNCGVFLENSARAYDYTGDAAALEKRLQVLRRMIKYVVARYRYTKAPFPPDDPRHGLIWGSPEADKGQPDNDTPTSHPYYYENASWTWRGLNEHARCLARAAADHNREDWRREGEQTAGLAQAMRADIERSLARTLAARNPAMKRAGITPFTAFDTKRKPTQLSSYENHRYMMDWWTSDWGVPALDEGHFKHRLIAGEQILGMNTDGDYSRTSNFMEHGTLAGRIRQEDYRPFLLALYGNLCYAMDCGNRYSPEDALLPGNFPGEGSPYAWSAVVNSELQPALGLRWLLCYEEHDRKIVHLQKAAPKHWFKAGEIIRVDQCPTRFGPIGWTTQSLPPGGAARWRIEIRLAEGFDASLLIHIHPSGGESLKFASIGELKSDRVLLPAELLAGKRRMVLEVS